MIRDVQADFCYQDGAPAASIVGPAGTYIAPNAYDTSPLGAYLTELAAGDTVLSASMNLGRDMGGGEPIKLTINWITPPVGGSSVDMQLVTAPTNNLFTPVLIYDLGSLPIASYYRGFRQVITLPRSASYLQFLGVQAVTVGAMIAGSYIAFLTHDLESLEFGYADGFSIK